MDKNYFDFSEALAFMKIGLEVYNDDHEVSLYLADDYFYATNCEGYKTELEFLHLKALLSNKWRLNE